jgi:hypothetical protein
MLTVAGLPNLALSANLDQEFFRKIASTPGAEIGGPLANAGDTNLDGFDDLVAAGAYYGTGTVRTVQVYSGADGSILHQFSNSNRLFGELVAGGMDINTDGHSDIAVMSWEGNQYGNWSNIYAYSGRDGSQLWGARIDGTSRSMVIMGDMNRDGYADVLAGAEQAAIVLSGVDGSLLGRVEFNFGGYYYSRNIQVGRIGDVNLDGYDDILAGNPVTGSGLGGVVKVFSGYNLWHILLDLRGEPSTGGNEFGAAVTGVGDLSGDGIPDVAVGAPGFARESESKGKIYLFSGQQGAHLGDIPAANGEHLGYDITRAGDLNGDGRDDLLISSFTNRYHDYRRTCLISGADGRLVYAIDGKEGHDYRSTGVGDLDQDGYPEFAVAETEYSGQIAIFRGGNWPQLGLQASKIAQYGWSTARVRYATPNATVYLCATYEWLGQHTLRGLNVTLSLLNPFLVMTSQADAAGQADFRFRAGYRHPDLTIFLQACEYGATSNWLYREL